ncbi:BnaC03g59310D [Brassica napus]|uniref:non-specific serine/threonine protein kinase n=1 Tax=Brassica napus TaxID=3708 RepID=A0A078HBZ3_BRANA|nr:BnaC03g59310D [Brassica napus]
MWVVFWALLLFFIIITSFFATLTTSASPALHADELHALGEITTTLGIKRLNLSDGDPCFLKTLKLGGGVSNVVNMPVNNIVCDCSFNNNMTCHITEIFLKSTSLPGKLPPELAKLRYLQKIDLCRNYLSGSIPMEWASMPHLTFISLCANNLSGPLPPGLQNFKNLTFLGVEANQFSGHIPDEFGNLTSLTGLELASNQFTGSLPSSLARLVNLEIFRISDNNFSGIIPEYIGNWSRLQRLDLQASGLKGPIPDAVARLENLTNLIISDMTGINSFPNISSQVIQNLILRNVSMSGPIPSYIWSKPVLRSLDLSFNKLTGEVLGINLVPKLTYLTGNMLSGEIKSGVYLNSKSNIDLSYNNFSWPSSCQERSNINTYRSSYLKNILNGLLPCAGPVTCKRYKRSLHINCGGETVTVTNSIGKITYQADNSDQVKAATNQHFKNWGISNTGDFMDDNIDDDTYIISTSLTLPGDSPDLYKTARRSALSLVYYAFCLENGEYNLKLHFMEIQFSDQELYSRLGRRIFDVYVQGKLFLRDFNIRQEANGTLKSIVKELKAVNVTDHKLEIWLYWAGKGTTLIPKRGNYGPLISAISLCHTIIFLALGFYAHRKFRQDKKKRERDLRARGLQTVCFTWRQLQAATNDFDEANKLGEGGFGSVFKGELPDGTIIAVKQLSSKSCQGNREFVNEIGMISGLNHPNLVKLYGCCVEKDQLLLVYEYMENNSLALVLSGKSSMKLDWKARQKICVGIARGLEFLHEGSMITMVHRDIKTPNVLLDADLNAKISDFGLARLHEEEHTHISTKVAGTMGYMAPEYVLWGQLTEKADVYSFGVVAMEIVSGKSNTKHKGTADHISLLDWALSLHQKGNILEVVDPVLEGHFNRKEAVRMINVALVCTNSSPALRPTMSEAVKMLEGVIELTQVSSDPGIYGDDWSLLKLRDIDDTHGSSSTSVHALEEIAITLGIKRVNLSYKDPCGSRSLMVIKQVDWNPEVNNTIACDCSFNNNMTCHITELTLVNLTLVGKVPPELAKLRHLRSTNITKVSYEFFSLTCSDLSANYLTGTIPPEWVSMPYLTFMLAPSLCLTLMLHLHDLRITLNILAAGSAGIVCLGIYQLGCKTSRI